MTEQTTVFGEAPAQKAGAYPVHLGAENTWVAPEGWGDEVQAQIPSIMPGYNLDGDRFQFPNAIGATLYYINSAGSTIWGYTPAAITASATDWAGFWLNDAEDLLYVVTSHSVGGQNYLFTVATINAAGTISTIGTFQPSDFGTGYNKMSWYDASFGHCGVFPIPGTDQAALISFGDALLDGSGESVYCVFDTTDASLLVNRASFECRNKNANSILPVDENWVFGLIRGGTDAWGIDFAQIAGSPAEIGKGNTGMSGGETSDLIGSLDGTVMGYTNSSARYLYRGSPTQPSIWQVQRESPALPTTFRQHALADLTKANARMLKAYMGIEL